LNTVTHIHIQHLPRAHTAPALHTHTHFSSKIKRFSSGTWWCYCNHYAFRVS